MTYTVSSTTPNPEYHAKLSDGTTEIPIIFCDNLGEENETAVQVGHYPSTAIKMTSGDNKYSDREYPFFSDPQDDWSGGRASEIFEDDRSRFYDSYNLNTSHSDGVILAGLPKYVTGYRNCDQGMPGSVTWTPLYGTTRYLWRSFSASASYSADKCEFIVRKVGTPNSGLTAVLTNSAKTALKTVVVTSATITTDIISVMHAFDWTGTQALTSGTTYGIEIFATSASDDATNHWEVATDTDNATNTYKSSDGSSWTAASYALYFRVTDTDVLKRGHFFELDTQLHVATQPDDDSAGKLFREGLRGAPDSNSGDLTTLIDATATYSDDLIGGLVTFTNATKLIQLIDKHWDISARVDAHTLQLNRSTKMAMDSLWTYIINNTISVNEITGTGLTVPVTDVAVANGIVYLMQGNNVEGRTWYPANDNGTFVDSNFDETSVKANYIQVVYDYIGGDSLWMATGEYNYAKGNTVWAMDAPITWHSALGLDGVILVPEFSSWGEQTIANVTHMSLHGEELIIIADAFTTGIISSQAISSTDIRYMNKIITTIRSTIDLAAGDLQLLLDNTANCASPVIVIDFPSLRAGQYTTVTLSYDSLQVAGADAIISVGLKLTNDRGACAIGIGSTSTMAYNREPIRIPAKYGRITNLINYGSPEKLFILLEGGFGYIDNNLYIPDPLGEFTTVKSIYNGRAACVNDVYLWMSFGAEGGILRYYQQNLDSVGLDQDAGLPDNKKGPVSFLLSYPGRVYAGVDGGTAGYSAIYCYRSGGWHEVYRAPRVGLRILSGYIDSVPNKAYDRLFFTQGADLCWIPIGLNPYHDSNFEYNWEGWLETGWMHHGKFDIYKAWYTLKLFAENLSASHQFIQVDYKTDNDTTWTAISGNYDTVPSEKIVINTTTTPRSRRIKFRIRFYTDDSSETPRLKASLVEGVEFDEIKRQVSFRFRIAEGEDAESINGVLDNTYTTVQSYHNQLRSWINNGTILTLNSIYSDIDGITGFINPYNYVPVEVSPEDQSEKAVGQITFVEI